MKYQVEIRNVLPQDQDRLILALTHAGYSVFLWSDDGSVCFEATDEDVTKIKD